jgi:hypothetical protein
MPVTIDEQNGLESAQIRISYDPALTVAAVRAGNVTTDFQWFIRKNEPGAVVIDTARLNAVTATGGGTLFFVDFVVPAGGASVLNVNVDWAVLNDRAFTAARINGSVVAATTLRVANTFSSLESDAGAGSGGGGAGAIQPMSSLSAPVIDWTTPNGSRKKEEQAGGVDTSVPTWKGYFVGTTSGKPATPTQGFRLDAAAAGDPPKPLYDLPKSSAF